MKAKLAKRYFFRRWKCGIHETYNKSDIFRSKTVLSFALSTWRVHAKKYKHDMKDYFKIKLLTRYFYDLKTASISLKTERALEHKVNEKVEEVYCWLENNVRRVEQDVICDRHLIRR